MKTTIPILLFLLSRSDSLQINQINSPLLPILLGPVKIVTHHHSFVYVINLQKIEQQLNKLYSNLITIKDKARNHDVYAKWLQAEFILKKTYDKFHTTLIIKDLNEV
ncbi:unnamed protein product [Acanthoscelides obtectus]|uniref:Uncharacterized protein n=1 Tax=Acanthoscelides obtectus TaxID=200917 RepID=A0A9P0M586_ACAOB|nr:unnamed protein product [Acanthoscelides obtectus]CAK1624308.1 hypothetical protein AOBTE_LOCUS2483 [Acanthoscelides obtectus]